MVFCLVLELFIHKRMMGSLDWYTTEDNECPSTRTTNNQQINKKGLLSPFLVDNRPLTSRDFFKPVASQCVYYGIVAACIVSSKLDSTSQLFYSSSRFYTISVPSSMMFPNSYRVYFKCMVLGWALNCHLFSVIWVALFLCTQYPLLQRGFSD